jgi:hypothetical protein
MREAAVDTVGRKAIDLQMKGDLQTDSIELQTEIHKGSNSKKSYEEEVWECINRGLSDPKIEGDFFVVVLFKKERHLQNIVRQYFFYRQSCPTPEYDQTVYKIHRKGTKIQYLWTVPNNAACQFLPQMGADLPEDQKLLLSMVHAFNSGKLDLWAKKLNKELVT